MAGGVTWPPQAAAAVPVAPSLPMMPGSPGVDARALESTRKNRGIIKELLVFIWFWTHFLDFPHKNNKIIGLGHPNG